MKKRDTRSDIGAAAELLVCSDLLRLGYHVFRSVSPTCPTDLVVIKNGIVLKVEVKSAKIGKTTGKLYHGKGDRNDFDVMALVIPSLNVHPGSMVHFIVTYNPNDIIR